MTRAFINATLITPDCTIDGGVVVVSDGKISQVGAAGQVNIPAGAQLIDANGSYLVPGFIDLQLNGGFSHDFTQNPNTIAAVARLLPRFGVTAFLPTIVTSPLTTIAKAQEQIRETQSGIGSVPLGLHLEGPFLNPLKKGAHNPAHLLAPQMRLIERWTPANGVFLVTLAPELPGALPVIERLCANGVAVAAGHTAATDDEVTKGIRAGIRYATHIFNAMAPLHHREPGPTATLLAEPLITVGLIPDGIHVHPTLIRLLWQLVGSTRLNLVTDGMAAMGAGPGAYLLGDRPVYVDEQSARLESGTLAGSIVTMDAALRNLITISGCSLPEAVKTVATVPAGLLGLEKRKGRIAPGFDADLVLLSKELAVMHTMVRGTTFYSVLSQIP